MFGDQAVHLFMSWPDLERFLHLERGVFQHERDGAMMLQPLTPASV